MTTAPEESGKLQLLFTPMLERSELRVESIRVQLQVAATTACFRHTTAR
ncbi:hypothetical protein [Xenorhabdus vietnamensis]|nr:hypothetical protein [Xenorhabdus vietnamensis]